MKYRITIAAQNSVLIPSADFELQDGRIHFLFGESGIGKTLIAKTLYGVPDPPEWNITVNGTRYDDYIQSNELQILKRNGFFVFQEPSTHLEPLSTIGRQLELNNRASDGFRLETFRRFFTEQEWYALTFLYPRPHRPSGGEKQRLFLVKAFLRIREWQDKPGNENALFIFDEPTAHLDNRYRNVFYDLLTELYRRKPFTVLIISHDYSVILRMRDSYSGLRENIFYHELRKTAESVRMHSFDPAQFIHWHGELKPFPADANAKSVLTVQPGLTIYGRTYSFRNSAGDTGELKVPEQSMVYLKAPSGFGKTLFVKTICGLVHSKNLRMRFLGRDLNSETPEPAWRTLLGKHIAMVFQHADETLNPEAPVIAHFRGLPLKEPLSGNELLKEFNALFRETLDPLFMKKPVKRLSGGQKQKVGLFRAMILRPALLILDEPFNGLDFISLQNVMRVIHEIISKGTSVLIITHDEDLMARIVPEKQIYTFIRTDMES